MTVYNDEDKLIRGRVLNEAADYFDEVEGSEAYSTRILREMALNAYAGEPLHDADVEDVAIH